MPDLSTLLMLVTAVVTAASILLKVVAPMTKNKKDDKVLEVVMWLLEKLALNTNTKKPPE